MIGKTTVGTIKRTSPVSLAEVNSIKIKPPENMSTLRAATEIESAALRDFVNYEIGARDFELHQHFCAGRGTHGEVAADVAARSQRPRRPKPIAQLEAQAAALASRAHPGLPS